jgi:membrane-associated phospholipid phosphatase
LGDEVRGQAAILSMTISSGIKVFTGRKPPGILNRNTERTNFSDDFGFGVLKRGAFDGWPSGHTMTAFAMATTLIELYPDNTPVKIGALTYASIIGLGVSMNIHWFSDAFAGALLGYAIGKTVGCSFKSLMTHNYKIQGFSTYPTLSGFSVKYTF